MKVNTGVLKTAESDLKVCRNRVEALNDELRAAIATIASMKGIEGCGKLKRISYDIEYYTYILSEMSEVIGRVAEIYDRNEEKVVEKRESSYARSFAGARVGLESFRQLKYTDTAQLNPGFPGIASMIERFF